jgi:hypothetical protein
VTNGMIRALVGASLVAAWLGCGPPQGGSAQPTIGRGRPRSDTPRGEEMPHEACVSGGGELVQYSVGGERPTPVVEVRRGGRLFCRETDANFDGRVDITRFFDEQGRVRRVEDDYDFDGKLDVVATYREGVIVSDVLDTNFDGRTDTWRTYRSGVLSRAQRDANSDGIVDMWEEFDERGVVVRTLTDTNADGQPDGVPDGGATRAGDAGAAVREPLAPDASASGAQSAAPGTVPALEGGESASPSASAGDGGRP